MTFNLFMDELGIKMNWAGTNPEETMVYDLVEVSNPEMQRYLLKEKMLQKLGLKLE